MPTEHTINLDYGLGSDIDMLRDTVRGFASEKIAPRAAEIDEKDSFPIDLWPAMGELGLHGTTVKEEYGDAANCFALLDSYFRNCAALQPARPVVLLLPFAETIAP